MPVPTTFGVIASGAGFTPQAQALFARMSPAPSAARKIIINQLIASLIAAGCWVKLDLLQVYAADAQANALLNWISASFNGTAVNSPTFTVDRGFRGDGSTSYIDTGYAAASGSKWAQNSHTFGRWLQSASGAGGGSDFGADEAATLRGAFTQSGTSAGNITTFDSGTLGSVTASVSGGAQIDRSSSGSYDIYLGGAFNSNVTGVSRAASSLNMYVCARNFDGSPSVFSLHRYAAVWAGASMTAYQIASLNSALATYMTAVGA